MRYQRTIAAGAGTSIDVAGDTIKIKETTSRITVKPSNRPAGLSMTGGDTWRMRGAERRFTNIRLENDTAASITFVIEAFGNDTDEIESINSETTRVLEKVSSSNVNGNVTVTSPSAELVAANDANWLITIQPLDGDIHIAKGEAATTNHLKISSGDVYECRTTEQIQAIRATAADVNTYWEAQRE